jgi:pimeloyl-ACP methyl ester carboxylesterase
MDVTTRDGRVLRVHESGDGFPVVAHHGTPSTGMLFPGWAQDGVRIISYDRPGYGGSSRAPRRTVADAADDVRAIADALGIDRFATWGISGGGPHALACAALLPDRVVACAALASPAPFDADGLDWFAGQGEENVVEHTTAAKGERELRPLLEREHAALVAGGAASLHDGLASLLGGPDVEALDQELSGFLHASMAVSGDVSGWLDDDLAFVAPWGFDLGRIQVPVLLRHGETDRFVPVAHAQWLADRIPAVEARITAADGHLTLYRGVREVQDWLREKRS